METRFDNYTISELEDLIDRLESLLADKLAAKEEETLGSMDRF